MKQFLKTWALPLSMLLGAILYFVAHWLPLSYGVKAIGYETISHYIQPTLIFLMLLLSGSKVRLRDMKPHRWQFWVLLIQGSLFVLCSLVAMTCTHYGSKVLWEGAMLAFICPTATAAAVITGKLGGSIAGTVTYLMMCNLMVSVIAPTFLPLVEPHQGLMFLPSFLMIIGKVFPLLICPLVLAQLIRHYVPRLHQRLMNYPDLAFHLWIVALALAITVTVRSIVHSSVDWTYMVGLAVISGLCCLLQFAIGKKVGSHYDGKNVSEQAQKEVAPNTLRITAGQAFGQKNTVFIIWMGLVFLDPVTSIVGGFYSVWHNIINSYLLYKKAKN